MGMDYLSKDQRSNFDQSGFPIYRADALNVMSVTPRARIPFQIGGVLHRLTVGMDLNHWGYDSRRTTSPDTVTQPINRVRVTQNSAAFYVQDAVQLTRSTNLTLGWRGQTAATDWSMSMKSTRTTLSLTHSSRYFGRSMRSPTRSAGSGVEGQSICAPHCFARM